jgi:hypothetical protein
MKKPSPKFRGRKSSAKQAKQSKRQAAKGIRLHMPMPKPVQVTYSAAPPAFKRRESIHPRRFLPRVREGRERVFHSVTERTTFHPPLIRAFAPLAAGADDLTLVTNTELPQPGQKELAANVGEPSVAANGSVVFYTGNWYAARSTDGGQTFQFPDPFTMFPDPPNLGFCCDQVVNYIAKIDTFVWLLQYSPKPGFPQADNIQRLAFATTAEVKTGHWHLFDITTRVLGVPGQFLDFPDLAVGANFLYVTTNIFTPDGQSAGAAVVRIPIDSISAGHVTAQPFVSTLNSFRVAQNCGTKAFFATHHDTSTLNVFTWDEGQATPSSQLVEVARWVSGSGFPSRTPDGRSWLDRADPRITGATLAANDLYFAWGVNAGSNHRPQPFIQIAKIDANDLTLIDNINVFDPDSATCYGALATNADDEVGISYMIGGGPRFPSHAVGILTGNRKDVIVAASDMGPEPNQSTNAGEWGDYLAVRPVFPEKKLFAASGYTLKGVNASNRNATPRFVTFGRAGNVGPGVVGGVDGAGTVAPAPPVTVGPAPATPTADGGPITDVNSLQVVSAEVAARIKAACGFVAGRAAPRAAPELAPPPLPLQDVPGTERWPVKTGQDRDRAKVGKNIVNGVDLGAGIVESTVEELISLPRPPGMEDATRDPPQFAGVRNGTTEVTIWRITAKIIALKHEKDGDYHLVLQGTSGHEMVAEIPTPSTVFIGDSPWLDNIRQARKEIDDKLVRHLSPANFAMMNDKLVPQGATLSPLRMNPAPALPLTTPPPGSGQIQPLFQTAITPTLARITGVGFFDRAHGATGAAPNVIELHAVLKIEWP